MLVRQRSLTPAVAACLQLMKIIREDEYEEDPATTQKPPNALTGHPKPISRLYGIPDSVAEVPKAPTRATGQAPNDTPQKQTQTDGDDDI